MPDLRLDLHVISEDGRAVMQIQDGRGYITAVHIVEEQSPSGSLAYAFSQWENMRELMIAKNREQFQEVSDA